MQCPTTYNSILNTTGTFREGVSRAIWHTRFFDDQILSDKDDDDYYDDDDCDDKYVPESLLADYLWRRTTTDKNTRRYKATATVYDTLDYLFRRFAIPTDPNQDYVQQACFAIVQAKRHVKFERSARNIDVRAILKDPEFNYTVQENALALAACLNLSSAVEQLVDEGIRDVPTCFGSPLVCMSTRPHSSMTNIYLKARLKLRQRCGPTFTSEIPISNGFVTVATLQRAHRRDISDTRYGEAITAAVVYGESETVKILMDACIEDDESINCISNVNMQAVTIRRRLVDEISDRWSYVLLYAVQCRRLDVVELALNHGGDPDSFWWTPADDQSALGTAAYYGETDIFKLLLHHGADINRANIIERQFWYNAVHGGSQEILGACFDAGLHLDSEYFCRVGEAAHPLYAAVQHNRPEALRFLIKNGMVIRPGSYLETAMYRLADELGNPEIVGMIDAVRGGMSLEEYGLRKERMAKLKASRTLQDTDGVPTQD